MKITLTHTSPLEADWQTSDFDVVEDALDELAALVDAAPATLALHFERSLPANTSLPALWRMASALLTDAPYAGEVTVHAPTPKALEHFYRYLPSHQRPRREHDFSTARAVITLGDLSRASADAIVNASNRRLELGGGVSHALHVRFGAHLQHQMRAASGGDIEDGDTVVTLHGASSGARALYHTASAAGDRETIRRCLETIMEAAREHDHDHVILPALGTGTGGLAMRDFGELFFDACAASTAAVTLELWCWTRSDYLAIERAFDARCTPEK